MMNERYQSLGVIDPKPSYLAVNFSSKINTWFAAINNIIFLEENSNFVSSVSAQMYWPFISWG